MVWLSALLLSQVLECGLEPELRLPPGGAFQPFTLSRRPAPKGSESWSANGIVLTRRTSDGALGLSIEGKPVALQPMGLLGFEATTRISINERSFHTAPKTVRIFRNALTPGANEITIQSNSTYYVAARCDGHLAMVDIQGKGPQAIDTNGDGRIDINAPSEYARLKDGVFEIKGKGYTIGGINWDKRTLLLNEAPLGPSLQPGEILPDFSYTDRLKETRLLSSHAGSYTLLDFWASWCAPCIAAFPQLKLIGESHNLKILGISGDEDAAAASRVLAQFEILWPDVQQTDPQSLWNYRSRVALYPTYILLDPARKVIFRTESTVDLVEQVRLIVPKRSQN